MSDLIRRPNTSLGLSTFEEFDKLFDDLLNMPSAVTSSLRMPSVDIYSEDDQHMVVEMQAPGFSEKDIDINVRNGVLEIHGETSQKEEGDKKRNYLMRESHASFARRVVLPEGAQSDTIEAELTNGILKITVPVERPEAKKIMINSSKDESKKLGLKSKK